MKTGAIKAWLLKECAFSVTRHVDDKDEAAETYFSLGHGDENWVGEDEVWIALSGQIYAEPMTNGTHNSIWGSDLVNKNWRGRYEKETGRVSIVPPLGLAATITPTWLMDALESAFPNMTEVHEF